MQDSARRRAAALRRPTRRPSSLPRSLPLCRRCWHESSLNVRGDGAERCDAASLVPGRVCLTVAAMRRGPLPSSAAGAPSDNGDGSRCAPRCARRRLASPLARHAAGSPCDACAALLAACRWPSLALALGVAARRARRPAEPHYWRQRVFFIPYQPNAQDPQADKIDKVQLLVSRDGGQQWAVLQEAEPHVRGFSYHAAADGEYAFALRMSDREGNSGPNRSPSRCCAWSSTRSRRRSSWPPRSTPPARSSSATKRATCKLKPETLRLEVQTDGGDWQRARHGPPDMSQPDRAARPARLEAADRRRPTQVPRDRSTTRAGNQGDADGRGVARRAAARPRDRPATRRRTAATRRPPGGRSAQPQRADDSPRTPLDWPPANRPTSDRRDSTAAPPPRAAIDAAAATPPAPPASHRCAASSSPTSRRRRCCSRRRRQRREPPQPRPLGALGQRRTAATRCRRSPTLPPPASPTPATLPSGRRGVRWVNSLTFDVDYDLQTVGPWGVAKVELWATRDGGRQWESLGADPDNRSPMRVTVPAAGVYGFRIVVDGANGVAAPTPAAGEQPELVVGVDLHEPPAPNCGRPRSAKARSPTTCSFAGPPPTRISTPARSACSTAPRPKAPGRRSPPTSTTPASTPGGCGRECRREAVPAAGSARQGRQRRGAANRRRRSMLNLPQPTGRLRSVRPVEDDPAGSAPPPGATAIAAAGNDISPRSLTGRLSERAAVRYMAAWPRSRRRHCLCVRPAARPAAGRAAAPIVRACRRRGLPQARSPRALVARLAGDGTSRADVLDGETPSCATCSTPSATVAVRRRPRVVVVEDADALVKNAPRGARGLRRRAVARRDAGARGRHVARQHAAGEGGRPTSGLTIKCQTPDTGRELTAFNRQLKDWLIAVAKRDFECELPAPAVELLIELLPLKPASCTRKSPGCRCLGGGEDRRRARARHVGGWRTRQTWDMIDAAADGRAADALQQLDRLLAAGEEPHAPAAADGVDAAAIRPGRAAVRPGRAAQAADAAATAPAAGRHAAVQAGRRRAAAAADRPAAGPAALPLAAGGGPGDQGLQLVARTAARRVLETLICGCRAKRSPQPAASGGRRSATSADRRIAALRHRAAELAAGAAVRYSPRPLVASAKDRGWMNRLVYRLDLAAIVRLRACCRWLRRRLCRAVDRRATSPARGGTRSGASATATDDPAAAANDPKAPPCAKPTASSRAPRKRPWPACSTSCRRSAPSIPRRSRS